MFKIMPFAGMRYRGDYANHHDVRQYFGFEPYAKVPANFVGERQVFLTDGRTTTLTMHEGRAGRDWRAKSSAHRTHAVCPDCGAKVPAGRVHQHKCKEA